MGQSATGQPSSTDSVQAPKSTRTPDAPSSLPTAETQPQKNVSDPAQPDPDKPQRAASTGVHSGTGYVLSADIYRAESVEFVPHTGTGKYASYLAMNIPFAPTERLRENLENTFNVSLKHRGEAHVTVVTPPEFERLSSNISIQQINLIAATHIQQHSFKIECLGESKTILNGEIARTFFLVISSDDLVVLRKQIALAYHISGGEVPAFLNDYSPHITIGFTHRDLHSSDGVIKNSLSCIESVTTHQGLKK